MSSLTRMASLLCVLLISLVPAVGQSVDTPSLQSIARRNLEAEDSDSFNATSARLIMIRANCREGKFEAALRLADEIAASDKLMSFAYVIKSAMEAGSEAFVQHGLKTSLALLSKDEDWSDRQIADLMDLAVKSRNDELASAFLSKISSGSLERSWALLKLSKARAASGDRKAAVKFVDEALSQIPSFDTSEAQYEFELMVELAHVLYKIGETQLARELTRRAEDVLSERKEIDPGELSALASLHVRLGNSVRGLGIVESLNDEDKPSALINLASQYESNEPVAFQLLQRAESLLLTAKERDEYTIAYLAKAYLRLGRSAEALALLPAIKSEYRLSQLAIEISEWFLTLGKRDDSIAVLVIASTAAEKMVSEKSSDIPTTASASTAQSKSHILRRLAQKFVQVGNVTRAEVAAKAIDHPQYRAATLADVAVALASGGERMRARDLLLSALRLSERAPYYSHDNAKYSTLAEIAMAAAGAGFKEEASQALHQYLKLVVDENLANQESGTFLELGMKVDSYGIQIDRKTQMLLTRLASHN